MEGMIGEIRLFASNFAPRSWAFCEGQLLPISQNTALFSILGTIYGGDGRTTFALPDLRGRSAMHAGNGPGLSDRRLGSKGGTEHITLNTAQMPSHTHALDNKVSSEPGESTTPTNNYLAEGSEDIYAASADADAGSVTIGNTGGNQSHENRQPWLSTYYIICLQGVFPSRS